MMGRGVAGLKAAEVNKQGQSQTTYRLQVAGLWYFRDINFWNYFPFAPGELNIYNFLVTLLGGMLPFLGYYVLAL